MGDLHKKKVGRDGNKLDNSETDSMKDKKSSDSADEVRMRNQKTQSSGSVEQDVAVHQKELDSLKKLVEHLDGQLKLAVADKENIKRAKERDEQKNLQFGIAKFLRDFLGIFDDIERLVNSSSGESINIEGLQVTWKSVIDTVARCGIERIAPQDEVFHPSRHQAVAEISGTAEQRGKVAKVFQCGYVLSKYGEPILLRPAMVAVFVVKE